jgi:NADH:ubiquinone oxidoreductase subunit 2 (subunit N)
MVSVWLEPTPEGVVHESLGVYTSMAVFAAAIFTIAIGVWPEWLLDAADKVNLYAR